MSVPTTFSELNTTPASNAGLVDNTTAVEQIDNHLQAIYAFIASVYANNGNGWAGVYLPAVNPSYTGTLTGGTGVVSFGSGQFYKDGGGNIGVGTTTPATFSAKFVVAAAGDVRLAVIDDTVNARGGYLRSNGTDVILGTSSGARDLVLSPDSIEVARAKVSGQFRLAPRASDPGNPQSGDLYFNSASGKFRGFDGSAWVDLN